jgi:hypothetical protein
MSRCKGIIVDCLVWTVQAAMVSCPRNRILIARKLPVTRPCEVLATAQPRMKRHFLPVVMMIECRAWSYILQDILYNVLSMK